ncbi:MAG: GerMN domain-containing protein [Candidatus Pacebacteria bacterium]|nr:GerMN domain-containing protein [Candidatus Paceibacterota bacterium]
MDKKISIVVIIVLLLVVAGLSAYLFFELSQREETPPPEETMTVKVFFNNSKMGDNYDCNQVVAVNRTIPKTTAVARAALEQLFAGPTQAELAEGYFTSINSGVIIQSLTIDDGTARADFNEQLEFQIGGSCRVAAIRAQIRETLEQFPTVTNVIISINGRTEDILQP